MSNLITLNRIDFQLFSEEEIEDGEKDLQEIDEQENDFENDDEGVGDEADDEEEGYDDESDAEVEEDVEEHEEEVKQEKKVPLKALQAEREKFKKKLNEMNNPDVQKKLELADKVMKTYGMDPDSLMQQLEQVQVQGQANYYVSQGYDEEQALHMAKGDVALARLEREKRDLMRDSELVELMKDPFYADATAYRNEIYDLCERSSLNPKQAYNALRGDTRLKEMQTDTEQRNLMKRRQVENKTVQNDGTTTAKDSYATKLTKTDRAAAKALNWSYEKYYKLKIMDSIE